MHALRVFVIRVEIEIVVAPMGSAAQAVHIIPRFRLEAEAAVMGQSVPALSAHARKIFKQSAFLPQSVYHVLQFIPERFAFQGWLMVKPGCPEFSSVVSEVTAKMSDTRMIPFRAAVGIDPINFVRRQRLPLHIMYSFSFCLP